MKHFRQLHLSLSLSVLVVIMLYFKCVFTSRTMAFPCPHKYLQLQAMAFIFFSCPIKVSLLSQKKKIPKDFLQEKELRKSDLLPVDRGNGACVPSDRRWNWAMFHLASNTVVVLLLWKGFELWQVVFVQCAKRKVVSQNESHRQMNECSTNSRI